MTTNASPGSRGPYTRSAERRRSIAQAVLDTVTEKGHENVTTAEVARRAGAGEATALYHFPTKEHLLVAALELSNEQNALRALSVDLRGDLDRLFDFAGTTDGRVNVMRLYTSLLGRATAPGHPARDFLARHHHEAVARFADLVRHRQEGGLAHPALEPDEVARQFIAAWDGLQAHWLLDPTFDFGRHLLQAFRRLTGQNWMEARAALLAPSAGL
jgi:AcrR family transcriptional regulator